jgi:hypothetical protein
VVEGAVKPGIRTVGEEGKGLGPGSAGHAGNCSRWPEVLAPSRSRAWVLLPCPRQHESVAL